MLDCPGCRQEAGDADREVAVFFTDSIRRKMVFGLALVLVMLAASTLSGLLSLRWYYNAVRDLDFSVNAMPRRAELVDAVGALFEPLQNESLPPAEQALRFGQRLKAVEDRMREFRRRLDALPPNSAAQAQRPVIDPKLARIDWQLSMLKELQPALADPEHREPTVWILHRQVAEIVTQAQQIPDPQHGLSRTIRHAIGGYESRRKWILWTGVVVLGLFVCLWRYGHCNIFGPLRQLHSGARRVAQGDFDYRVRLKRVGRGDEIQELAEAFNQMTARFQEIKNDLDGQVEERSKQLVRSERLAGIGFLSAGVAHEINNPLSAIAMAAESLEGRSDELFGGLEEDDRSLVVQYLSMIQRESFRCQQITRRLLDFARGQENVRSTFDLTETVVEVLEMVGHMGKYRERNIVFGHVGPVTVEGNGPEVKQVVLNLVANAMEAMDDGGTLTIGLDQQTDAVLVSFRDDGCGMTPETIDHLFEPFFTRRKGGKGTGLGLSISHRIVADHGGTIEAASAGPGTGSTFRIRLPKRAVAAVAA